MTTIVKCPECGLKVSWNTSARFKPFCSERCKLIDLGAWASERHSIAGKEIYLETESGQDNKDDDF